MDHPSVLFQHLKKCVGFDALVHHLLRFLIHLRDTAMRRCCAVLMFNGSTNVGNIKIPQVCKPGHQKAIKNHRTAGWCSENVWKSNLAHSIVDVIQLWHLTYVNICQHCHVSLPIPSRAPEASDTLTLFGVGQEVHDRQELCKFDELITPWKRRWTRAGWWSFNFWQMTNP